MTSVVRLAVMAVLAALTGATDAQAQTALRLHEAVAVPQRPLLCGDREAVNLIVPVLARAAAAKAGEAEKSQRLTEIATRLQGEVCRKPAAEDVVILRCKLGQVDAGGSSLALVKISALIQNEAAKGEQPFYAWTDLRIDDAAAGPAAQEANTRWCAAERATRQIRVEERESGSGNKSPQAETAGDAFHATPDIVLRVQQRLYDFGLRMDNLDGNLNQETVRNLVQFQKFAKLNADGTLTRSTIDRLMTTPAPSPWVTIAFDGFGNFAAETGRTRRDTELNAIERLQRRSGRDFKLSSVAAPNCLGFAVTRYTERNRRSRTKFTQAFTSAGDSADTAARNAWDYCEREKGGGECQVRYALCANGSGGDREPDDRDRGRRRDRQEDVRRHDRDSPPVNAPAPKPRFDPDSVSANSPAPKFDPGFLPLNSQAPQERPSAPSSRSDPRNMPVNSPNPNAR
jgi:hypothetical protein